MGLKYICEQCGEENEAEWTEEEAHEEAKENFGVECFEKLDMAVICDDCFRGIAKEHGLVNKGEIH